MSIVISIASEVEATSHLILHRHEVGVELGQVAPARRRRGGPGRQLVGRHLRDQREESIKAILVAQLSRTFTPDLASSLEASSASKGAGMGTTGRSLVGKRNNKH